MITTRILPLKTPQALHGMAGLCGEGIGWLPPGNADWFTGGLLAVMILDPTPSDFALRLGIIDGLALKGL